MTSFPYQAALIYGRRLTSGDLKADYHRATHALIEAHSYFARWPLAALSLAMDCAGPDADPTSAMSELAAHFEEMAGTLRLAGTTMRADHRQTKAELSPLVAQALARTIEIDAELKVLEKQLTNGQGEVARRHALLEKAGLSSEQIKAAVPAFDALEIISAQERLMTERDAITQFIVTSDPALYPASLQAA